MATGIIDTRPTKVGEVLKHEYEPCTGFCRREVVVTVPAAGLEIGAVLESTSVPGKYTLVANATQADADGVLIDTRINDEDTVDGDFTLAVLVKGPAQVRGASLSYNADVLDPATAEAALDALGIQVL